MFWQGEPVSLEAFTNGLRNFVGWVDEEGEPMRERRREYRHDFCGDKVILRQRRALGILHLRDVSANGASGLTDMPLAVGSAVFVGLSKPYFHAAEVIWVRRLTIGLRWFKPIPVERLETLHEAHLAAKAVRETWGVATMPAGARRGGRQRVR